MRKLSRPVIALGAGLALVLGTGGAALATLGNSTSAAPVVAPATQSDDDGGLLGLGLLGDDDGDNDGLLDLGLLGDDDDGDDDREGLLGTGLLGEDGGLVDVDTLDVQLIVDGLRLLGLNLDGLDDGEGPVLDIDGLLLTVQGILAGKGPGQGDGPLGLNLLGNDDIPGPSNAGGLLGTGLLGDGGLLGAEGGGDADGLLGNLLGGDGSELGDGDDLLGNDPL